MNLYNLNISLDNIEIIFFKNFPLTNKLTKLKSDNLQDSIFESISDKNYIIYKINNNYYSTDKLTNFNEKIYCDLYIINIPNIYIHNNNISYIVNLLNLTKIHISNKLLNIKKDNIYIYLENIDLLRNDETTLNVLCINNDKNMDFKEDVVFFNKKTSIIGLNPKMNIIYENVNITEKFTLKIFNILKILCIINSFYDYKNLFIINSNNEKYENDLSLYKIYKHNFINLKIDDIIRLLCDLHKLNNNIYI